MAREPVLAAGGIVLRQQATPLVALVRLRKRDEWVLPKGKLDDGETPRDAAEREVREETGHDVHVHEFIGTLVYEFGGRSKIVHYWRMEAKGEQVHELMHDVKAVAWLPLETALTRLSRGYERAFLANVGPLALEAARPAPATRRSRENQPREKANQPRTTQLKTNQPALEKRRGKQPAAAPLPLSDPTVPNLPLQPDLAAPAIAEQTSAFVASDVVKAEAMGCEATLPAAETVSAVVEYAGDDAARTARSRRMRMVQKAQEWLRRTINSFAAPLSH
jgi:8-oxo-dGTP diphosphatase